MLVLFVLTIVLLFKRINATETELKKIKEINESIEKIDSTYFEYDSDYKRHTLKNIQVSFNVNSSNIEDIDPNDREHLKKAWQAIVTFMKEAQKELPSAKYLLIVEGQSSKDNYRYNYRLSYERALSLVQFWSLNGITFDGLPCEVIISGSGQSSKFRVKPDNAGNKKNQRFVIHIVPKPGIIE
jgi:outer membrane protein OmpA-like peptidoglycan-associated protein